MKRFRINRSLLPAATTDAGFSFPAADTFKVAQEADRLANQVWMVLIMAAGEGDFGPFTERDVVNLRRRLLPPPAGAPDPLTPAKVRPRLRKLVEMKLLLEVE